LARHRQYFTAVSYKLTEVFHHNQENYFQSKILYHRIPGLNFTLSRN